MAEFNKEIPKHPNDCDKTVDAVLENITQHNKNGYKLVRYAPPEENKDKIILTYDNGL